MIKRVRLVRFKRFPDHVFDIAGRYVLLAGPNNSGKTTLLHAISAWNLARLKWLAERGAEGGKKKRISIGLDEFTALPLREMNLLWLNRHAAVRHTGQKQPKPAPVYIEIVATVGERVEESLTMEFLYANEKLVFVRPVKSPDDPTPIENFPVFAKELSVVFVPAFSGIGTQEPKHALGMQSKLVGEGKPGEIVRNLLLEIWEKSNRSELSDPWKPFADDVERLFQCRLLPPEASDVRPYILCEYSPKARSDDVRTRAPRLDIANAGSGFHQVLLLLSFFYAKHAALLLLDEPDAHLHVILQREIFDHLRAVAEKRRSQLLIGTHAEVLLEDTDPSQILSFLSSAPARLTGTTDKKLLRDAMRMLTALDLLQLSHIGAVLYVEDYSDHKLLREWARNLKHRAYDFLQFAYVVPMRGRGNVDQAKRHFACLRLVNPKVKGTLVLDRDEVPPLSHSGFPGGLALLQWKRYEIENYLLHPEPILRYLRVKIGELLANPDLQLVRDEFAENLPANIDFLGDTQVLRDLKGSEFLVNLLAKTTEPLAKSELYILAQEMRPEEIHSDIVAALDAIAATLPHVGVIDLINQSPVDVEGVLPEGSPEADD